MSREPNVQDSHTKHFVISTQIHGCMNILALRGHIWSAIYVTSVWLVEDPGIPKNNFTEQATLMCL